MTESSTALPIHDETTVKLLKPKGLELNFLFFYFILSAYSGTHCRRVHCTKARIDLYNYPKTS
jgi:hypothetical protein